MDYKEEDSILNNECIYHNYTLINNVLDENNLPICDIKSNEINISKNHSMRIETLNSIFALIVNDEIIFNKYRVLINNKHEELPNKCIKILKNLNINDDIKIYLFPNTPIVFKGKLNVLDIDKRNDLINGLETFGRKYNLFSLLDFMQNNIFDNIDLYISENYNNIFLSNLNMNRTFYYIPEKYNKIINYYENILGYKFKDIVDFNKCYLGSDCYSFAIFNNSEDLSNNYFSATEEGDNIRKELLTNIEAYKNIDKLLMYFRNLGIIKLNIKNYELEDGYNMEYIIHPSYICTLPLLTIEID